jgi:hypothetical protein
MGGQEIADRVVVVRVGNLVLGEISAPLDRRENPPTSYGRSASSFAPDVEIV